MHENELKYVVGGYVELEQSLTRRALDWQDIEQGYLNPQNRVRRIRVANGDQSHIFTYKQRMPNGHNLELEAVMSHDDFVEAWPHTIERLTKRRFSIAHGAVKWDIDFYRWSHPYFVLAEVEMPPDMSQPDAILPELQNHLIYAVPRTDNRFTARRLANESHAHAVAQALGLV